MNSQPPADSWDRLVSAALAGTSRRPAPDTPDLPKTPAQDDTRALLDRAALATVRRLAGHTPATAAPVEPDHAPAPEPLGEAAMHRLALILDGRTNLLPEWLDLVAASGRTVAPTALPALLDQGARESRLRPALAATVGERGRWLARHNPAWAYLASEALTTDTFSERDWTEGTPAERRRALAVLRATDPAAARERLDSVWSGLGRADLRRTLLDTFATGLGPGDADLLDRALDDRSANVRGTALSLLTRLPDSAHAHRLRGYVHEYARKGEAGALLVDPVPRERTEAFRDLALAVPKKADAGRGELFERSWALVTHAPLDVWTTLFDTDPGGVAALVRNSHEPRLWDAFVNAVGLQGNAEWARAMLLAGGGKLSDWVSGRDWTTRVGTLLAALPEHERGRRLSASVDDGVGSGDLAQIVGSLGSPWSTHTADLVYGRITGAARTKGRAGDLRWMLCDIAALHLPPEYGENLPEELPRVGSHQTYTAMRDTLRFRLDMHKELR
ncbi:DUF5691 domain-containing protein [Nocardiopsis sp. CNT312]|uniref:DUF5691 domain-containing protein n=1 Tax=Nocardiopsis sp. CNT312 TaxID=1137268 RepID=UPI00048BD870|nr:DUF5691 domain-containing protein [Nocardiopsis sp. CNT312]